MEVKSLHDKFAKVLEQYHIANKLGDNDYKFVNRIFENGIVKYRNRLSAIGFSNYNKVLDAGCGFGQWSLALAELNTEVYSCDISPLRTHFLLDLASELMINNITVKTSKLEVLPYDDQTFDAVFCYGVIFLSDWKKSLAELKRVLKPGGNLYLTANELGWYLYLWKEEHNKANDYDPKAISAKVMLNTLQYARTGVHIPGEDIIIAKKDIVNELESLGFKNVFFDCEGTLHLSDSASKPEPFFLGEYSGQLAVYEVLANL
jgi:ubiquinone/menaquinone biosynthesis C-methylase UbiE